MPKTFKVVVQTTLTLSAPAKDRAIKNVITQALAAKTIDAAKAGEEPSSILKVGTIQINGSRPNPVTPAKKPKAPPVVSSAKKAAKKK
jgi:hypothetical protein